MPHESDCRHVVADYWGCRLPRTEEQWRRLVLAAVEAMNVNLLRLDVHLFEPQGGTAIAMLAESHLAIHTWPERDYVAVDVFTCGASVDVEAGLEVIRAEFQPKDEKVLRIDRGDSARPFAQRMTQHPLTASASTDISDSTITDHQIGTGGKECR